VADFVNHIDYLVKKIGIDHVGISSDFDGGGGVTGWNGADETFNVTLELVRRGYTEEQIGKLWSGNLLRVMDIRARYGDRFQVTNGSDDQTLDFYLWGATSWICGPANCMAKACVDLVKTIESGNWIAARDKALVIYGAMASLESGKFVQKVKYGCELAGTPVGIARRPLLPLNAEEKADFRMAMEPVLG
jgi:dihydrodipicolinate synthase/N-acetylneuraminate lyase